MNPVEAVNTILQLGILHRWFLGRQKGVRLGQFSHESKAKKSKSEYRYVPFIGFSPLKVYIDINTILVLRYHNTVEAQRNR
jgi:hypothetical protein